MAEEWHRCQHNRATKLRISRRVPTSVPQSPTESGRNAKTSSVGSTILSFRPSKEHVWLNTRQPRDGATSCKPTTGDVGRNMRSGCLKYESFDMRGPDPNLAKHLTLISSQHKRGPLLHGRIQGTRKAPHQLEFGHKHPWVKKLSGCVPRSDRASSCEEIVSEQHDNVGSSKHMPPPHNVDRDTCLFANRPTSFIRSKTKVLINTAARNCSECRSGEFLASDNMATHNCEDKAMLCVFDHAPPEASEERPLQGRARLLESNAPAERGKRQRHKLSGCFLASRPHHRAARRAASRRDSLRCARHQHAPATMSRINPRAAARARRTAGSPVAAPAARRRPPAARRRPAPKRAPREPCRRGPGATPQRGACRSPAPAASPPPTCACSSCRQPL